MGWKTILTMALVTVGTMFVANQAAAMNPTIRGVLKGNGGVIAAKKPSGATRSF